MFVARQLSATSSQIECHAFPVLQASKSSKTGSMLSRTHRSSSLQFDPASALLIPFDRLQFLTNKDGSKQELGSGEFGKVLMRCCVLVWPACDAMHTKCTMWLCPKQFGRAGWERCERHHTPTGRCPGVVEAACGCCILPPLA